MGHYEPYWWANDNGGGFGNGDINGFDDNVGGEGMGILMGGIVSGGGDNGNIKVCYSVV